MKTKKTTTKLKQKQNHKHKPDTILIRYKEKEYRLNINKVLYVLNRLYDTAIKYENDEQLIKLINDMKLSDEVFFNNVNKIEI